MMQCTILRECLTILTLIMYLIYFSLKQFFFLFFSIYQINEVQLKIQLIPGYLMCSFIYKHTSYCKIGLLIVSVFISLCQEPDLSSIQSLSFYSNVIQVFILQLQYLVSTDDMICTPTVLYPPSSSSYLCKLSPHCSQQECLMLSLWILMLFYYCLVKFHDVDK